MSECVRTCVRACKGYDEGMVEYLDLKKKDLLKSIKKKHGSFADFYYRMLRLAKPGTARLRSSSQ